MTEIENLEREIAEKQARLAETLAVLEQARKALVDASSRLGILSATALADERPATAAKIAQWEGEAIATLTTLTTKIEEIHNGQG